VRPAISLAEPTWLVKATATTGSERSICKITWSPLSKVNCSKATLNSFDFSILFWEKEQKVVKNL
jgi:hypothetical protein